ncbi:MAG: GlsB/YeaQ/YmgE family stress response membrane protein [Abitibacteriaceae bacterium]|nr:GlsB/YeaQ/YmgE family stress response membrane protein [Abditibacteriaceae bacterium]MBV9868327.1 GlsB/YeaQ/YmgE family stress response membrane protein [Abditibacteriaceae bacterium]
MIITILAGAFIGWIASMIMKTDAQMGAIANIVAGLLGAFVGGFIANMLGFAARGAGFGFTQLLFGVIGACIVIGVYKAIAGPRPVVR